MVLKEYSLWMRTKLGKLTKLHISIGNWAHSLNEIRNEDTKSNLTFPDANPLRQHIEWVFFLLYMSFCIGRKKKIRTSFRINRNEREWDR